MVLGPTLTSEEFSKKYPNSPFTGQQIHFVPRRTASSPSSSTPTPPNPAPSASLPLNLTDEQKAALIAEYHAASKDGRDAATLMRMFGTTTKAWQRAIEREQEATRALQNAGIPIPARD
jgi:hypothetical protein